MSDEVDKLLDDAVENEPRVREEIIERLEESNAADSNDSGGGVDSGTGRTEKASETETGTETRTEAGTETRTDAGTESLAFDPNIYEVDGFGVPRKNKDGSFRRKRGRKPGNAAPRPTVQPVGAVSSAKAVDYRGLANFVCGVTFGSLSSTLGEHWEPTKDERGRIELATAAYAESMGFTDIPPGIALCIAFGLYAMPRIVHPETKRRAREIGERLGIVRAVPKPVSEEPVKVADIPGSATMRNGVIVSRTPNPLDQFRA